MNIYVVFNIEPYEPVGFGTIGYRTREEAEHEIETHRRKSFQRCVEQGMTQYDAQAESMHSIKYLQIIEFNVP